MQAVLRMNACSVTLPAGAGKTELIAATAAEVAKQGGATLVLTHTHAGVDAIRRRMKKFGVVSNQVVVRTIDSWSYDLIVHFPMLAGLEVAAAPDWTRAAEYHLGAARAVGSKAVGKMISISYTNLLIDEYQDCLTGQHELAVALAKLLPTAVFGDPLQSLFNFGRNQPVDWASDVLPGFPALDIEHRPRRWDPDHGDLGTWLVDIRDDLLHGRGIDLTKGPVNWIQRKDDRTFLGPCYDASKLDGTIAVLGRFRPDCVSAASKLNGLYSVMEAIDEKVPATLAAKIDASSGAEVAKAVVEFAVGATIGLATHIASSKRKQLGAGGSFGTRNDALKPAYDAILQVRNEPLPSNVIKALDLMRKLPNVTIFCWEAWDEVRKSVVMATTDECSVVEALQRTRNHTRAVGRRSVVRIISRPLLVKGLEYDHVIVLNPESYSAQELYVALTRGSKSVSVVSDNVVLPAAEMATTNKADLGQLNLHW